jgi:hypothetical protein
MTGIDTNNVDYRTPGWMRDPTAGVLNTSGFPGATPQAPTSGAPANALPGSPYTYAPYQDIDSYSTALHNQGFTNAEIMSLLNPNGYTQDAAGNWQWGWGMGPVVSTRPGGGGYAFARQASGPSSGGGSRSEQGVNDLVSAADLHHGMASI